MVEPGCRAAMDPSWRTAGIDLYRLLHDQSVQFEVIHIGMKDLREGDGIPETDWLGNPPPASSAGKRRKPVGNTLPDILRIADAEDGDEAEEAKLLFAPAVDVAEGLLQQTAAGGAAGAGPHLSTWLVLFFLLASDRLRDYVMRGTPPHIAGPYFEGFESRISTHICGEIVYTPKAKADSAEKRAKSGSVIRSAVSPAEAVASEWLFLDSIIRRGLASAR